MAMIINMAMIITLAVLIASRGVFPWLRLREAVVQLSLLTPSENCWLTPFGVPAGRLYANPLKGGIGPICSFAGVARCM